MHIRHSNKKKIGLIQNNTKISIRQYSDKIIKLSKSNKNTVDITIVKLLYRTDQKCIHMHKTLDNEETIELAEKINTQ